MHSSFLNEVKIASYQLAKNYLNKMRFKNFNIIRACYVTPENKQKTETANETVYTTMNTNVYVTS